MRLTLRTLLAYRDQVLEAKDAEVLEQRLRESQTAQTISDRINNIVSNPSVPQIEIDAQGFGFNANDVACFLDDTMATDRVADMERACLDNNPLLAEVASCHQILVKTVSTPVQIPTRLRNRIQSFSSRRSSETERLRRHFDERHRRYDAQHLSVSRPFGIPIPVSPQGTQANGNPEHPLSSRNPSIPPKNNEAGRPGSQPNRQVPQYLREPKSQWIGTLLRLVILVSLLAICILKSLGSRQRLVELLDRETSDWSSGHSSSSSATKRPLSPEPTER
jgi:hypothetical protein